MSYFDKDPRNRDPLVGFRVKAAFVLSAFLLAIGFSADIDAQNKQKVQTSTTPTPCVPAEGWQQDAPFDETIEVLDNCGHIIRVHPGFVGTPTSTPTPPTPSR